MYKQLIRFIEKSLVFFVLFRINRLDTCTKVIFHVGLREYGQYSPTIRFDE